MKIYRVNIGDDYEPHFYWSASKADAKKYAKNHSSHGYDNTDFIEEIRFTPTKRNILEMMNFWARQHHC
tara:strand:+ start:66 stop:272 length:207 start_codon:yes stop_codon:yes gene_type:complete